MNWKSLQLQVLAPVCDRSMKHTAPGEQQVDEGSRPVVWVYDLCQNKHVGFWTTIYGCLKRTCAGGMQKA